MSLDGPGIAAIVTGSAGLVGGVLAMVHNVRQHYEDERLGRCSRCHGSKVIEPYIGAPVVCPYCLGTGLA